MNLDQICCCGYTFSQHPSMFRREQCSEPGSDCLLWLHEPRSDLLLWLHFRPISQHVQEGTVLGTWIRLLVVATWTKIRFVVVATLSANIPACSGGNSARNLGQIACCGYLNLDQICWCGYISANIPACSGGNSARNLGQIACCGYMNLDQICWCGYISANIPACSGGNSARNLDLIASYGYMNLDQICCCGYTFSQHLSMFRREQCSEHGSDCLLWLHEPRSDLLLWLHFQPTSQHVQEGTVLGTWIRLLVVATWT